MTDSQLRQLLLAKLGVTPQAMYYRARRIKQKFGPMTTEDAIYWIAVDEGLDISKFLDQQTMDRIRDLRRAAERPAPATAAAPPGRRRAGRNIPRSINIAGMKWADPILPSQILDDARRMAEQAYPLVYLFENSVREVIRRVMAKNFGAGWWENKIAGSIKRAVQSRIDSEDHNAWHGRRGTHPVYYTNIGHLSNIVVANWSPFEPILPSQAWFTSRIDEVEMSRNVLEHNNPLRARDVERLKMHLRDWQDQIASKRTLII